MFSGIIREIGIVERIVRAEDAWKVYVRAPMFADSARAVAEGDSIAVCGVCLTHTAEEAGIGSFDIATETLRVTTLGQLSAEKKVNIERSLCLGDSVDGHFVSGHVDGVAEVCGMEKRANTIVVTFEFPAQLRKFLAPKGSVTIDGVSLTLGDVTDSTFSVYIIPQTFKQTLFSNYEIGTKVNLEVDMLARYAVNALESSAPSEEI